MGQSMDKASLTWARYNYFHNYLLFAAIGLFIAALGSYGYYYFAKAAMIEDHKAWIQDTLNLHSARIQENIQQHVNHGESVASNPKIQDFFIQLNKTTLTSSERSKIIRDTVLLLEALGTEQNYKNSIFISPNGAVLFSDFAFEYKGLLLTEGKGRTHVTTELSDSFMRTIMGLVTCIGYYVYDPILKRPALFITIPVLKEAHLLGVLAIEVPSSELAALMKDYVGVGKKGDEVYGIKQGEGVLCLNESRAQNTNPFKRYVYYSKQSNNGEDKPLVQGSLGRSGVATAQNNEDQEMITGWSFIPRVDWSSAIKILVDEELPQLYSSIRWASFLALCIAFMILLFFTLVFWGIIHAFITLPQSAQTPRTIVRFTQFLFILISVIIAIKSYYFMHDYTRGLTESKKEIQQKISTGIMSIEHVLNQIEAVGLEIARDLSSNYLKKDSIKTRMERDLEQFPLLHAITVAYEPYKFDPSKRLYAPMFYKQAKKITSLQTEEVTDYTLKNATIIGAASWQWYAPVLKAGETWFSPFYDPATNSIIAGYSIPFFDPADKEQKKAIGVVNVMYYCESMITIIKNIEIGKFGYSMLLDENGTFMYYPSAEYVTRHFTIFDRIRELGNETLLNIEKKIVAGADGYFEYPNTETGEQMLLYAAHIKPAKWILNVVFSKQEAALSLEDVRINLMQLLVCVMILMFIVLALFFGRNMWTSTMLAYTTTIILSIGLMVLLAIVWIAPIFDVPNEIIITDQSRLQHTIDDWDDFDHKINVPESLKIPFGLYITAISFLTSNTLAISGYIWEKFEKGIAREMIRPLNFINATEKVDYEKLFEKREGNTTIACWRFDAKLAQKFKYRQYPFDPLTLYIELEHPDRTRPIALIPDLASYDDINPRSLPGIFPSLELPGFKMEETLFAFKYTTYEPNLGLTTNNSKTDFVSLMYNLMMQRNIFYDFIVFFLPVMIIFFSLYAIFIINEKEKMEGVIVLSAYTGLIFVVTLLHRDLRERYNSGDILYLEYLFFLIYIAFSLLIVYGVIKIYVGEIARWVQSFYYWYRIMFWPIQLMTLFVITYIVFYP